MQKPREQFPGLFISVKKQFSATICAPTLPAVSSRYDGRLEREVARHLVAAFDLAERGL